MRERFAHQGFKLALFIFIVIAHESFAQNRGLEVVVKPLLQQNESVGRQIAVLIAIDKYEKWLPLKSPVKDAERLHSILSERYYFDEIKTLYNDKASKTEIMKLFENLRNDTKEEDSLFIYYAGHGYFDQLSQISSWIPKDAGTDRYEQRNWLPNPIIRNLISNLKTRHVLLVSDSCFSGDILNINRGSAPEINNAYFKTAYARKSRQVISSGASEEVPDDSVFSRTLIDFLETNKATYLDPLMIYNEIRLSQLTTLPLIGMLKDTGYQDGGSYLFFLKDLKSGSSVLTKNSSSDPDSSILRIAYLPPGANVYVDNKLIGTTSESQTSINYTSLSKGEHLVTISMGSFNNEEKIKAEPSSLAIPKSYKKPLITHLTKINEENKKLLETRAYYESRKSLSVWTSIFGIGGSIISFIVGKDAYNSYKAASDYTTMLEYRKKTELLGAIFSVSASVAGAGIVLLPFTDALPGKALNRQSLESAIKSIDSEIENLTSTR